MKLGNYLIKRTFLIFIVMFGVATIVFFITHLIPADPIGAYLGPTAPIERVEALKHELGLDKPISVQFIDYIKGIPRLDFGNSLKTGRPVIEEILKYLPATIELTIISMVFATFFGIILGVLSAVGRNTIIDHFSRFFSILGVSMPDFWLGLLLLWLLYYTIRLFPGGGRVSLYFFPTHITGFFLLDSIITRDWTTFWDAIKHIILPAFVLGYQSSAAIARIIRSSMLDILQQDFIRTAKSKGLSRRVVIFRHALKNSLIPAVTVIGISVGRLLGGTVIVETVFSWPGLGRYLVNSLIGLDYPSVTGGTLLITFTYSFANLLVDIFYVYIDPRMKL